MSRLILHYASPSRASSVHWMLEEIGEPYELRVLDLKQGEQRSPDYLALNPMGKVPTLQHGGAVIAEAAAICCYLADAFPSSGLAMPVGDARRGPYLKWLFFGPSCLEPALVDRAFPRKDEPPRGALGWGDLDTVIEVLARAVGPGPYLMGESFTAADIVIGSGLRWGQAFNLVPDRPEFRSYVEALEQRPAFQRATARGAELAAQ